MIPKFRAWDEHGKRMIGWYDRAFLESDNCCYLCDIPLKYVGDPTNMYIYMQFTGAKDMHGTDIYEGDIIRKEECSPDDPAFGHYGSIGTIQYDVDVMGFIVVSEDDGFYDNTGVIFSFDEIEVIGNIYENPNMLEM